MLVSVYRHVPKNIGDLIASIQTGVAEAVKAMEGGSQEADRSYELAVDTGTALDDISKNALEVGDQVGQIDKACEELRSVSTEMVEAAQAVGDIVKQNAAATQQMTVNLSQVSTSIHSVAGVVEQNTAVSQQVAASTQEMSAQVQEVVASAQSLAHMSEELQTSVESFKLHETAGTTVEAPEG